MISPSTSATDRASRGKAATFTSPVIASGEAARQSSKAQARWTHRLALYRRLQASWKAEAETGAFRAANDEYARARADLIARFGSWEKARRSRIGKPLCSAAFAHVSAIEDAFYARFTAPMNRAAMQLVMTPAPDLHALLAKIEVIREHELETDDGMRRSPIELLREDVSRLEKE